MFDWGDSGDIALLRLGGFLLNEGERRLLILSK